MKGERARRRRAQAMVEFAAIATILFLLVFAILEFGRGFFYYNTVVSAAQEGARYGVSDQAITCVKNAALSKTVALDIVANDVTVVCPYSCSFGNSISVTVNYMFTPVVALIPGFPVQGNAAMRIARTYNSGGTCY